MKLNLISDIGGRAMARAMMQAYQMGYDDAKKLAEANRKIYPRKTGFTIAKSLASKFHDEQASFLRNAYGAGMWQYKTGRAPKIGSKIYE